MLLSLWGLQGLMRPSAMPSVEKKGREASSTASMAKQTMAELSPTAS